jgi:acyl-CoA reductase-like NAD-dependent aldehyde dehydrogenase
VDKAVDAAEKALEGEWKRMGAKGRQQLMLNWAEVWKTRIDELAELEALNNGTSVTFQKTVIEGLLNEIKYHAGWCDKIDGRVVGVDDYHVYTSREPIGVCGMIIAWNLPLWCCLVKLAPCIG